ncbi:MULTISPECIES: hypothetical protein [Staphylococcus]|uniref:hypothetical protein n=1 Tax=Staphylococcus TaxID=1279 RepID=UPI000A10C74F|nr:hypothetical protein [Staphylococcus haemolyticus]MDT4187187.1 hypothetical protein [Staphylococcus aureus]HDH4683555.1 hypothetical protein [Staphylococcus aureus]HDK4225185.1 hypothetical protein [Staphylococcus aureus]HDK4260871.1 hypothetical protein [Staphylococcus aureus]HEH8169416.1 hypothetical protein [Staphylococcus aureus]
MDKMNKVPFIVLIVGIVFLLAFQNFKVLGLLGLIIFMVGVVLVAKEMHNQDCIKLIKEINANLKKLGFSDEEIKERQHELRISTKPQLKQRKRQTEEEIERKRTSEFFDPLDK